MRTTGRAGLISTAVAVISAVVLAGCGGGDTRDAGAGTPTATVTATATVTETPAEDVTEDLEPLTIAESEDAEFWEGMEQAGEDVPEDARATIADLGRTACAGFDMGKDIVDVGMLLNDGGFTIEQSGHILGSAIRAYCPEHDDQLGP